MFWSKNKNHNGPVNAHLRSAVYTNVIEKSPSIGADEALGPFYFSEQSIYCPYSSANGSLYGRQL